ncbi:unnamed protein product [Amoebophrya sp. A120]|nr:unnamed protein product [Amoebophrya sp. A120]|eukprot:GSA120T00017714001.1
MTTASPAVENASGHSPARSAELLAWQPLVARARSGSMLTGPLGAEGSAGKEWDSNSGSADHLHLPTTLILCDLFPLTPSPEGNLPDFPLEFHTLQELDLSGCGLLALPESVSRLTGLKCLFLGGVDAQNSSSSKNQFKALPSLANLKELEQLSVHDTNLQILPALPENKLASLRVDRCPLVAEDFPTELPRTLTTLHLEGCPLGGSFDEPEKLPAAVKKLEGLLDLQMPDGSHVGEFFGTPLQELLRGRGSAGGL